MKKLLKLIALGTILGFAAIGVLFSGVFVAMQYGLLNVPGTIEARNEFFLDLLPGELTPHSMRKATSSQPTAQIHSEADYSCADEAQICPWNQTREWNVVAGGLSKDAALITRVAKETGVPGRLIAAVVIPEQVRFFTSDREVFKRYFEPLKILGSLSKFSLGVSGIKQDTAEAIERHAADPNSPFYPGPGYSERLAYPADSDADDELFLRLTNEKDHYYSYLYTAIFIKEILAQWNQAGYDISDQSAVVATIFNIGFNGSKPNADPKVGGTSITLGGTNYSFGTLAGIFYNSPELLEEFPR